MVLAKQQKKQEGRLAGILRGKTKRAIVSLVAATALTLSMAIPAFAVGGQMQSPGTNIVSGVYQIDVDSTAFTAPSKFWGGDDLIPDTFAVVFYGGYIASQTSRGTSYGANLASTATDLSYGTNTVGATVVTSDSPVGTSYTATADSAGMVTFPGIVYGGNYTIIAA